MNEWMTIIHGSDCQTEFIENPQIPSKIKRILCCYFDTSLKLVLFMIFQMNTLKHEVLSVWIHTEFRILLVSDES